MTGIPKGLIKCEVCGQYKGRGMRRDLNCGDHNNKEEHERSTEYFEVSCLCDGILCRKCMKEKINRPISNSYFEESNEVWHWPWFQGMKLCRECKKSSKEESSGMTPVDPEKTYQEFKKRFNDMSDDELIGAFNREVGKPGWTGSRATYLSLMNEEFEKRKLRISLRRLN